MSDGNYLNKVRKSESGNKDTAVNPMGGASGRYQFVKSTWEGLGYNWKDRFNPQLQEEAMAKYTSQTRKHFVDSFKSEPSDADLYGMHFLGSGTYIKALKSGDKTPITDVVSKKAYDYNKNVMSRNGKPITVGDLKQWLGTKMGQTTSVEAPKPLEYENLIASIDTELPQGAAITFSEKEETKTEGEKAVQLLNEENFLEDFVQLQAQAQEAQQVYQQQSMVTPLEVSPIEYVPPTLPQQEFQNGGVKKTLHVDSKNDPRYKAYQDSLIVYNGTKYTKDYYEKNIKPLLNKKNTGDLMDKWYKEVDGKIVDNADNAENRLENLNKKTYKYHTYPKTEGEQIFGITQGYYPKQKVELKQPVKKTENNYKEEVVTDLPKVKSLNLPPIQINNSQLNIPQNLVESNLPNSYTINYDAPNLIGGQMPIENTFLNGKEVSAEEMRNIITRKNNYNNYIEEKYGNEEALKNPKAVERLNKLKQSLEIIPNYKQEGGEIPVSSRGVYDYPMQKVIVPTDNGYITMKDVNYPILGIDEFGNQQMMQPNKNYKFKGKTILEIPQFKR